MKSLSKNVIMTIITRIVTLITGLVVQQRILVAYGSSLNGLTSSITQVMSYLVILEAGLGTASVQALYSPLAAKDWDKASGIVTATGKEYKKISIVFFLSLLAASVLIPLAVSGQVEFAVASALTLITGGSYIISYILGGKYKALLNADRKLYILCLADCISIVLSCVLRVIALELGYGIVIVQLLNLGCVILKNACYVTYVKKRYDHINYQKKPDYLAVNKRWNVLIHSLAGLVVNHTDVLILTIFADLKIVSLYSIYNMVFSQLSTVIQSTFMQAPQSNFGYLYNSDKKEYERYYGLYEIGFSILLFIIVTIALIMILPFVSIYTRGITDIQYVDAYLPILFTLILLMNQIRVPAIVTINVAGAFKETQNGAIIEALINIIVSLVLFFFTPLGLYGLLIGTVCSYIYRTSDVIIYVYKHLIERNILKYVKLISVNTVTAIILYILFNVLFPVTAATFIQWIIKAIIISLMTTVAYIISNYCINHDEMKKVVDFCLVLLKSRKSNS